MKTSASVLSALLVLLLLAGNAYSRDVVKKSSLKSEKTIVKNLLAGLEKENDGLTLSTSYYLGEYKASKAVIPLMHVFNSSTDDCLRIQAALSLAKIGDGRGIKLLKYAASYDNSDRVKRMCEKFYRAYLSDKK